MSFSKGKGYKSSWYRVTAADRGMNLFDLVREVKREHKHLMYLSFPDECRASYNKWCKDNPEKCHSYYEKRWVDDKKGEYARTRKWLAEHPEKQKEYSTRQRTKDPDKTRQQKREEYKRHSDKYILRSVTWSRNNPDKKLGYCHARRAKKMATDSEDCSSKINLLRKERFCHWCCCFLTPQNWTTDHVIPLKRGGKHCPDNLVASCRSCNCSKSDKLVSEWLPFVQFREVA